MARQYSFIYKSLVQGNDDLIGHIAYSIYKTKKINFIKEYREKNSGGDPTDQEFNKFHEFCNDHLQGYRLEAQGILLDYTNQALVEYSEDIDNEALDFKREIEEKYTEKLKITLEKQRAGFWKGVAQSIVGSFGFTVLLGVLFMFSLYFGLDAFFDKIRKVYTENDKPLTYFQIQTTADSSRKDNVNNIK